MVEREREREKYDREQTKGKERGSAKKREERESRKRKKERRREGWRLRDAHAARGGSRPALELASGGWRFGERQRGRMREKGEMGEIVEDWSSGKSLVVMARVGDLAGTKSSAMVEVVGYGCKEVGESKKMGKYNCSLPYLSKH